VKCPAGKKLKNLAIVEGKMIKAFDGMLSRAFFLGVMLLVLGSTLMAQEQEDALVAFREGRYQDAIRITNAEIAASPARMDSYAVQGWTLMALGRWADAVDLAQRGLQIARYDHRLIAIMGEAQFRLGNNLAALQYLQEYTAIRPEGAIIGDVYAIMAEVHVAMNEFHHADIALSTSLYFGPGNAENWARLGFIREQAGSPETALAAYERALELNGNLSDAARAAQRLRSEIGG
jgi:tetratricopeptide (TPR) repeat protein